MPERKCFPAGIPETNNAAQHISKYREDYFMFRYGLFFWLLIPAFVIADTITVRTNAPENRNAVFCYRVPQKYDKNRREAYRVLVIFGGRNTDGKADASGRLGWGKWCDDNGIFIVSPGLKNDNYWEPEAWSGRALLKALAQLRKKYKICTDKILYYGYSAGSQASNLFPAWKPGLCRAWVSHACGVFHEPTLRMKNTPGLVTCGDADQLRYIISRDFVDNCRKKGLNVIWKSFPNLNHAVPPDSIKLAQAFLAYYHELYRDDLIGRNSLMDEVNGAEFIGDDQEEVYYPVNSPEARNVLPEDRVELPDKSIAEAWGKKAE